MKKLALILAILMLASCLFACSAGSPEVMSSAQAEEKEEREEEAEADEPAGEDAEEDASAEEPAEEEPAAEAVFSDYPSDPHPSEAANYCQGNAASNLSGGGLVCKKDGVIYYVAGNMKTLNRVDEDGANQKVLFEITGEENDQVFLRDINVFDGYVYFCMGTTMYRIPADGSTKTADAIVSTDDGSLEDKIVCDDGIFIVYWDGRISIKDGSFIVSDRVLITADLTGGNSGPDKGIIPYDILYDEGKLVHSVSGDNIYVKDMATGKVDLISHNVSNELICVQDGWVYYRRWDGSDRELFRVKLDGSDEGAVGCDPMFITNIYNQTAYFTDFTDNSKLYSQVILDGTELSLGEKKLIHDANSNIVLLCVIDGWIHFATSQKGVADDGSERTEFTIYRMRPDGTELEVLE